MILIVISISHITLDQRILLRIANNISKHIILQGFSNDVFSMIERMLKHALYSFLFTECYQFSRVTGNMCIPKTDAGKRHQSQ